MSDPVVSICIPAFNAERHLEATLESIRAQTFADWELIVVEDGSRDGAERIVRQFAATVTQRVSFARHETNSGLPATRNTAISRARGEWIALIDADDLWTPTHLAIALNYAERNPVDFVHTGVMLFDSDSGRDLEIRAPMPSMRSKLEHFLFTGAYPIQPSSVVMRRSLCERTGGFDPGCRYVEDREYWLRLLRAGARIGYVDTITCRYRQHAGAMTRNAAAIAAGLAQVLERNADWPAIPERLRREQISSAWLSAGRLVLRKSPDTARSYFSRALRFSPASPRILAYWGAAALLEFGKRAPGKHAA